MTPASIRTTTGQNLNLEYREHSACSRIDPRFGGPARRGRNCTPRNFFQIFKEQAAPRGSRFLSADVCRTDKVLFARARKRRPYGPCGLRRPASRLLGPVSGHPPSSHLILFAAKIQRLSRGLDHFAAQAATRSVSEVVSRNGHHVLMVGKGNLADRDHEYTVRDMVPASGYCDGISCHGSQQAAIAVSYPNTRKWPRTGTLVARIPGNIKNTAGFPEKKSLGPGSANRKILRPVAP